MSQAERSRQSAIGRLAAAIATSPDTRIVRWGVIDATHTSPNRVDVLMNGTVIPDVRYLASYSPSVSDTVMMLLEGSDLVVIGTIA